MVEREIRPFGAVQRHVAGGDLDVADRHLRSRVDGHGGRLGELGDVRCGGRIPAPLVPVVGRGPLAVPGRPSPGVDGVGGERRAGEQRRSNRCTNRHDASQIRPFLHCLYSCQIVFRQIAPLEDRSSLPKPDGEKVRKNKNVRKRTFRHWQPLQ